MIIFTVLFIIGLIGKVINRSSIDEAVKRFLQSDSIITMIIVYSALIMDFILEFVSITHIIMG